MLRKHSWQSCEKAQRLRENRSWGFRGRKEGSVATPQPGGEWGNLSPIPCFIPPIELFFYNINLIMSCSKCKTLLYSTWPFLQACSSLPFQPQVSHPIPQSSKIMRGQTSYTSLPLSWVPGASCRERASTWHQTNLCSNSGSHVFTWKKLG